MSIFLVVMLLALIVIDQWAATQRLFFEAAVLAVLFSGFAALACWGIGFMLRLDLTDRYVFSVEFAIRNIGIAAVTSMPSEKQSSPGYRSLPTATEDQLASGKWSAGITGVVLTQLEWNFQFTWQFLFPKNSGRDNRIEIHRGSALSCPVVGGLNRSRYSMTAVETARQLERKKSIK